MSNNNFNNFNLNAPEFVPKFDVPAGPPQPRGQLRGAPINPFPPQQYYQQPPQQYYQAAQQPYRHPHQQQPQHFPQQYQQAPPPQQQYYYPQQQQYNNNVPTPASNQQQQPFPAPLQQVQPVVNNNHSVPQPQVAAPQPAVVAPPADKVAEVSASLNKMTVESPSTPVENAPKTVPVAVVASVPVSASNNDDDNDNDDNDAVELKAPVEKKDSDSSSALEPSVLVERSLEPSVASIKEDEEWEDGGDDATTDKADCADEATKPKKKQLVIREYKAKKEPINVIFCGHVDAGKSTIGGQIMHLTGMIDKRTLEKYEREAKEKNRESWYLSWALDTNLEEREKGKTVEVGRAFFETEKKHFIILDAPGHKGFVPNMIGGASQADIAVLVISARRGEFETGFERGGQTREHAMLVKTAGVKHLIVLVNKMDDSTVNWDVARYEEIKEKLTPYLKKCGFAPGKDTYFMPCSGYTGAFIKDPLDEAICPWYRGPCFIEYLETLPIMNRTNNGPLRMPIVDKYKDMGTIVMGKIESGMVRLNDKCCIMPNKVKVEVTNIYCDEDETDSAICGENVKLKLKGIEEEEITGGFVLCDLKDTCQVAKVFDAQVIILECPSTCPIICPGFNSIMHMHAATVEVQLKFIIGMVDKKTGEKDMKNRPRFIKQDQIAICRFDILNNSVACMEPFKLFPQLGRFTLRCESKTVAVGKVLKVVE